MLDTAESRWGIVAMRRIRGASAPPPSLWAAVLSSPADRPYIPPTGQVDGPVVLVRANHGVWQACCPFCPSAQHAPESHLFFYCAICHNEAVGHKLVPVEWPANRAELEAALLRRPHRWARSWEPGETLEDLERQDADALEQELA